MNKNLLYRRIPKVDVLLEDEKIRELTEQYSYDTVLEAVREELDKLRALIGTCEDEAEGIREIEQLSVRIQEAVKAMYTPMPTDTAFFSDIGITLNSASRTFVSERTMKIRPSTNTASSATCHG